MIIDRECQEFVLRDLQELGSISKVAHKRTVNKGLVSNSARYAQHSPTLRKAYGLPPLKVEIEPCWCGKVHKKGHPTHKSGSRKRCIGRDAPIDFTDEMVEIYRLDVQAYSAISIQRVRALYNRKKRE